MTVHGADLYGHGINRLDWHGGEGFDQSLDQLINRLDTNQNGKIDQWEFRQAEGKDKETLKALDTNHDGKLSRDEIEEGKEALDANRDGIVTKQEVDAADANHDGKLSKGEMADAKQSLHAIINRLDKNDNGRIDPWEFRQAEGKDKELLNALDGNDDGKLDWDEIQSAKNGLDANGDGVVSKDELETADTNHDGTLSKDEVQDARNSLTALINRLDKNQDGELSRRELAQASDEEKDRLRGLDADHDGKLSADEIEAGKKALDQNLDGRISQQEFEDAGIAGGGDQSGGLMPAASDLGRPGGNPAEVDEAALAAYQPDGVTAEGRERVAQALAYFQDPEGLNLTPEQAAGLVGNLQQESGVNLNPTAVGDGGRSFGIAQWLGPRREALEAFAQQRGTSSSDFRTQLEFLAHEFRTTERNALDSLRAARTPEDAAQAVSDHFLRPGIPVMEHREANARKLLPIA